EPLLLRPRALVKPNHARPQRGAVLREDAEGLALVGNADRRDTHRIDLRRQLLERAYGRVPPIGRVLLEIAGQRIRHGDRRPALGNRPALAVPGNGLGGGRRGVDADNEVCHHPYLPENKRRRLSPPPHQSMPPPQSKPASLTLASTSPATASMHFVALPP